MRTRVHLLTGRVFHLDCSFASACVALRMRRRHHAAPDMGADRPAPAGINGGDKSTPAEGHPAADSRAAGAGGCVRRRLASERVEAPASRRRAWSALSE